MKNFDCILLSPEVENALVHNKPALALETAVVSHGLPFPTNVHTAESLERIAREVQVTPATIGLVNGVVQVGFPPDQLSSFAQMDGMHKISIQNLSIGIAKRWSGGLTVSATLRIAHMTGIKVFATGGIGGVHRGNSLDVSADLTQLAITPMIVVCAGAKAILDLPATLEILETKGVPVIGYQTGEFPAFYSRHSSLPVTASVDTPAEIASLARTHWQLGMQSAILVANPPPQDQELPFEQIDEAIQKALADATSKGVTGSAVTPFLLEKVAHLSKGESIKTNIALLENNVRLAAQIALALEG